MRPIAGHVSPSDFVRLVSTAAAQTFGMYPKKVCKYWLYTGRKGMSTGWVPDAGCVCSQGHIAPGSDADIIIFDPDQEHVISSSSHHSRIDSNIYEGKAVRGKARPHMCRVA